ncbi:MAG: acyl carrier protein [Clostridia bacterium]|nr:acyl carrier protein [Clostridia bacterium]
MTRTEIIEKLKEIILQATGNEPDSLDNCSEASNLTTDLGMNSIALLFVVIAIEETFDICFDEEVVSDFKTVGDVVNYIESEVNG